MFEWDGSSDYTKKHRAEKNDNVIIPAINFIAAANMSKLLRANIFCRC